MSDIQERHRERVQRLSLYYLDRAVLCSAEEIAFRLPPYGSEHALRIYMELVAILVDLKAGDMVAGQGHWWDRPPPVDDLDMTIRNRVLCGACYQSFYSWFFSRWRPDREDGETDGA